MKVVVWSKRDCSLCEQSKSLLAIKGIAFEERKIGDGWMKEELLEAVPTAKSLPQIFIDEKHIGGFTELKSYLEKAEQC
jgi:glutaredoxin 3